VKVFVVERYLPATGAHDLVPVAERDRRAAASMADEGVPVRHLTCIHVPSDESCFSLFAAPSAEDVRRAHEQAGIGFERIVEAVQVTSTEGGTTL
jgi:hypothetical protein